MLRIVCFGFFFILFNLICQAQTPTPTPLNEETEQVYTEEIKINAAAYDRAGNFVSDVKAEDLVITEDGRLHQANSVRLIVPSVLIAMDTGGETRQVKNIKTTRDAAKNLVNLFAPKTEIALMNFHDKVEFVSEWKTDKAELLKSIESRTTFGRRSSFTAALEAAYDFLQKSPSENRHLILITDALDSTETAEIRGRAIEKMLRSGIVVHVVSYSQIEYSVIKPQSKIWRTGEHNPKRMPEEIERAILEGMPINLPVEVIKQMFYPSRLLSIMVDFPYLKEKKSQLKALIAGQAQLSVLSEYSGGEFILPESIGEFIEKSSAIAKAINSHYVVTYSPKRPLKDSPTSEIRQIEVSSRRPNLQIQASRKLIVFPIQTNK